MDSRSRNPAPGGSQKSTGSGPRRPSARRPTNENIGLGKSQPVVPPSVARPVLNRALSGNPSLHGGSVRSTQSKAPSLRSTGRSASGEKREQRRTSDRERLSEFKKAEQLEKARLEKKELIMEQIRKEKIRLLIAAAVSLVAAVLWVIAISLDHWFYVYGDSTRSSNKSPDGTSPASNKTSKFTSNAGLWKVCRTIHSEDTDKTWCKYHSLFPSADELKMKSEGMDKHVIDYQRTEGFFATVSILLMFMAVSSAFYTFQNSRYMFKRLTAGLYLLSCGTVLMVLEVVITCVRYEKNNVEYNHPKNSSYSYGFCFYAGWCVFFVYLLTAALFLVYSRKRKGDKALDDDDEGQIMGR